MGRRRGKHKRLFPANMGAGYVKASRMDHNRASALNSMRSKATLGSGDNTQHNPNSNFLEEIPPTRSLTLRNPTRMDGRQFDKATGKFKHEPQWRSPRGEAVDKKHELQSYETQGITRMYEAWQSKRGQGVIELSQKIIDRRGDFTATVFFSGLRYIVVQETPEMKMQSIEYDDGLAEARRKYIDGSLRWYVIK